MTGIARLLRTIALCATLALIAAAASGQDANGSGPELGLAVGIDALRWQDDAALDAEFDRYVDLGVAWLRTDLRWRLVQPDGPDGFDWSSMDRIVALARDRGIRVLPVLGTTPDWARADPGRPSAPADPARFAAFAAAALARYGPEGIDVWEIWNEPNVAGFWPPAPDAEAYAALLREAADAMRRVDPDVRIVSGGLAAVPQTDDAGRQIAAPEFLERLYAAGAGTAFDIVGMHPYSHPLRPGAPEGWNGWNLMRGPMRDLMIANGDADKPVWITEYGAPTSATAAGVGEEEQAGMLVEAFELAAAYPWIGPLMWYSFRDLGSAARDATEGAFGLVREDGTPKPAYGRFRALSSGR